MTNQENARSQCNPCSQSFPILYVCSFLFKDGCKETASIETASIEVISLE